MIETSHPEAVLSTERVLSATPQEVFAAFARPDLLAQWWGPDGFTNTFEQFEFQPGGQWIFKMHAPNGTSYHNENYFRAIEQDKRIVVEHVLQPWFRLTVTLTPHADGTHLSWNQEFESVEMAEKFRPLAKTANEQNLDRLEAVLASAAP